MKIDIPAKPVSCLVVTTVLLISFLSVHPACAMFQKANYDESKVPAFELPAVLKTDDGKAVRTYPQWTEVRQPDILELFRQHVYGRVPDVPFETEFEIVESDDDANPPVPGALRRQVNIKVRANGQEKVFRMLIYLPRQSDGPIPCFLSLNFDGNHAIVDDPAVLVTDSWVRNLADRGITNNRTSDSLRGIKKSRWPVEEIVRRGYGLATIYYGDIDPDYHDQFQNGVHAILDKPGEDRPDDGWGSIAAWAWGLSRALDYFETAPQIDAERIALLGHSRLGKTALWAGANDPRFAIVISNNSGCGGAALSRREFGETVARINKVFPHWFCSNFHSYGQRVNELPVDQHLLIAAIAPRPVYVASASDDRWADPRGEFLALKAASPAYALCGRDDLSATEMPPVNQSVGQQMGYHLRQGKHDVTPFDWQCFMDFADRHFQIDAGNGGEK
ncbi:MAG: acetylxylan esterase [Mariniblastus sp.]|nr:acetylxylan esterase [Mariniblastus sp.]